jgi:prepilin-type N-terminal cleavage/methylation domain-containing protein
MMAGRRGFTLIELMVSLLIFILTLTAVYGLYNNSAKAFFSQENTVAMTQDLRAAMELMVHEIRMAGYSGFNGPFDPALPLGFLDDLNDENDTDGNSIHFTRDIGGGDHGGDDAAPENDDDDGDGAIDEPGESDGNLNDPNENINYYRYAGADGTWRLGRCTGGGCTGAGAGIPQPVMDHVTELAFRYFDREGTELHPPLDQDARNDIRSVEITLAARTGKPDRLSHRYKTSTLVQRVRVRNAGLKADLERAMKR